jgi:hypothetical protein
MLYVKSGYWVFGYAEKIKPPRQAGSGREPFALIQIDQDFCNLNYGEGDCTAQLGVTGSEKCYNTRKTCQAGNAFSRGTLTLNFATPSVSLSRVDNIFPFVNNYNTAPTKFNPFAGNLNISTLGERAVLSVTFNDAPHTDNLVDPYVEERTRDPLESGTFWTKWLARNYYQNRNVRLFEGFVGDALEDMTVRHYLIDAITVPGSRGVVSLTAKDPLKLVDKERAQIPPASTGRLSAPIIDIVTNTFTVDRAEIGDYDAAGLVRIGDEIVTYTAITQSGSDLVFTGVLRGQFGSTAKTHDINASVQNTIYYQNQVLYLGIKELLVEYAGIDPAFIDDDEWEEENDKFLAQFSFTSVLSKPASVFQVLNELTQQLPFYVYWDERANKIRFEASRYYSGEFPLITEDDIVANSFNTTTNPRDRISQVWIYHTPRDWTKDDIPNYTQLEVTANLEIESRDFYDEQKIRVIESKWLSGAQAVDRTNRLIRSNFDAPLYVTFSLDTKDSQHWVGSVVDIEHRSVVDFNGDLLVDRYLIYGAKENILNGTVSYDAVRVVALAIKRGLYMDISAPLYENATEQEKLAGAWFADAEGQLDPDDEAFQYE